MNNIKFNQWFKVYLIVLYLFASFFLYQKYNIIWTGNGSGLGDFKGIIIVDHTDSEIVKGNLGGPESLK